MRANALYCLLNSQEKDDNIDKDTVTDENADVLAVVKNGTAKGQDPLLVVLTLMSAQMDSYSCKMFAKTVNIPRKPYFLDKVGIISRQARLKRVTQNIITMILKTRD